ncbi:MAG: hypothetical protein JSV64_07660 [Candidatus Bathyarchaeota archaeon]|nr:MAG: hypothetical protein JSV64_07660 [Candidatus Bathyarchaeota archaeon]
MSRCEIVASLDLITQILADPVWSERAGRVKTLEDMRQMIVEFGRAKGRLIKMGSDTILVHL